MMKVKYIGKSFDEEVEILVGTLINLPFDYTRYDESPYILHFDAEKEAQDAFVQLNHFVFSCRKVEPVLDGLDIEFLKRPFVPPSKSYLRERDAYIRKLFKDQVHCLERMIKFNAVKYKRRKNTFHFTSSEGLYTIHKYLNLDPIPTSKFGMGLLKYKILDDLTVEVYLREDIPYE